MKVHNTEITAFYLELVLGLALLYPLSRMVFSAIKNFIYRCRVFYIRKKRVFNIIGMSKLYGIKQVSLVQESLCLLVMFYSLYKNGLNYFMSVSASGGMIVVSQTARHTSVIHHHFQRAMKS